jgi:lipid II:glycine glycyltransferase (peptidoglycan interpeptide bridge formation enzyme)
VDLRPSEEQLLASMKQKTRYNIRLAEKNGVIVRVTPKTDLDQIFMMYAETSIRNSFTIRNQEYYLSLWSSFIESGLAVPLTAYVDREPIAGLILFYFQNNSWYFYGMSLVKHREKMPNYLLQWEAMKYAKSLGCTHYDFWGAPSVFNDDDPMIGVYRFKSGFGGDVYQHIGAWDFPVKHLMYKSYTEFVPIILDMYRRKGYIETRRYVE